MEIAWLDVLLELIMIKQIKLVIVAKLNVQVVEVQLNVVSVILTHSTI